jgi:hypothetical protein
MLGHEIKDLIAKMTTLTKYIGLKGKAIHLPKAVRLTNFLVYIPLLSQLYYLKSLI